MIKVLVVETTKCGYDGITNVIKNYFLYQEDPEIQMDLVTINEAVPELKTFLEQKGRRNYQLPYRNRNPLKYVMKLRKILKEGGYQIIHTKVPQICPIRSCRYYFPALSQGYDAFYVNWGIDDGIADYLEALQLDQYDGIYNAGGLFGRDENRLAAGYSLEHTGYFDGTRFGEVAQAEGRRMDLAEDMRRTAFQFGSFKEPVSPKGESCKKVEINFGACVSSFEYDEATGTYQKSMNGTPHIDGNTNQPLTFINLFVLETEISVRDEVGHKNLDWDGGSDSVGYYISNGMIQKVQWAKEPNNERSKLAFYDETGNEIKVNRGKSYIALNYANQATFQ